jgi:hypothetical protein
MNQRKIRDLIRFSLSLLFFWVYIPHIVLYFLLGKKRLFINADLNAISHQLNIKLPIVMQLLYQLHNNRYFRHVFYYRIGPAFDMLISWYRPGDKYFWVPFSTKIGEGLTYAHPYSTILNAESIGRNFS